MRKNTAPVPGVCFLFYRRKGGRGMFSNFKVRTKLIILTGVAALSMFVV